MRRAAAGLALAVALLGADDKAAPQKPVPPEFAQLLPPAIRDKLGLSEEQKEDVARLQAEFKEKCVAVRDKVRAAVDKIRGDGKKPLDRAAKRQLTEQAMQAIKAFQKLKGEYEPKLRALLTDEQKRQYGAWLKAAAEKEQKGEKTTKK